MNKSNSLKSVKIIKDIELQFLLIFPDAGSKAIRYCAKRHLLKAIKLKKWQSFKIQLSVLLKIRDLVKIGILIRKKLKIC